MLNPNERRLLMDAVRPPDGFQFDQLLATTFSLDLVALLGIPLALSLLDGGDEEATNDTLRMLEAVRRQADNLSIFCQAGQISCPNEHRPLFAWLESAVVEALPLSEHGVFHPKVWFLRYLGDGDTVRYRMLCLSRNLTFDRSWDSALVLEGDSQARKNNYSVNRPLVDFVRAMNTAAKYPLAEAHEQRLALFAEEVGRVQFAMPEAVSAMAFHPIGIKGYQGNMPFMPRRGQQPRVDRLLAMAPFVSPGWLDDVMARCGQSTRGLKLKLLSRIDTLQALAPAQLHRLEDCRYFHQPARDDDDNDDLLSGLHAKLFIADQGYEATVWTGSANATAAAFNQNVEFLVELQGKKSRLGITKLLERQQGVPNLVDMLIPFEPDESALEQTVAQLLEKAVGSLRHRMVRWDFSASVVSQGALYDISLGLNSTTLELDEDDVSFSIGCRPLTLGRAYNKAVNHSQASQQLLFEGLSLEALCSFFVLEINAEQGTEKHQQRFVINVPITGMPEGRQQEILLRTLKNRGDFMRYLQFLLAADDLGSLVGDTSLVNARSNNTAAGFDLQLPLLEQMVNALHTDPTKLDQIARLVEDLEKMEEGAQLFPDDFQAIWQPLWQARQAIKS